MAEILRAQGHLREAAFYFSEALKRAPSDLACEINFELAEVYETQGDMEKAASEFLKISYLYPNNMIYLGRAQLRAAKLYEDLNKPEEALKVYQKIANSTSNQADFAREKVEKLKFTIKHQGR